jgi:hypothetical protein
MTSATKWSMGADESCFRRGRLSMASRTLPSRYGRSSSGPERRIRCNLVFVGGVQGGVSGSAGTGAPSPPNSLCRTSAAIAGQGGPNAVRAFGVSNWRANGRGSACPTVELDILRGSRPVHPPQEAMSTIFSIPNPSRERAERPLQWADLAAGRLRLARLCRNGASRLSSPGLRPFLAKQQSRSRTVLR